MLASSRKQTSTTTRIATPPSLFTKKISKSRKQTSTTTRIATPSAIPSSMGVIGSETNIHYNKDCDQLYKCFDILRSHVGNKHPLQQGLRHIFHNNSFQCASETNIHYNKDCDVPPFSWHSQLLKSETNIHYNKDCDAFSLKRSIIVGMCRKQTSTTTRIATLKVIWLHKLFYSSETNIHYNKDCDVVVSPFLSEFQRCRKQTSTTTRIATSSLFFILFCC